VLALDQSLKELRSAKRSAAPSISSQSIPSPGLAATLSQLMEEGQVRKFGEAGRVRSSHEPDPHPAFGHPLSSDGRGAGGEGIRRWLAQLRSAMPALKIWFRVFLVVGLVAGISAVQLLPFLDLLAHSDRDTGFADSSWALPALGWANLLVPLFNCFTRFFDVYAQYGQYWTSSYYMGVGVLLLALAAVWQVRERRVWILVAMALVSWILALGDHGHLYAWLRHAIPQFGFMRYPVKFVVGSVFCIPLLAAFAMRQLAGASAVSAARA